MSVAARPGRTPESRISGRATRAGTEKFALAANAAPGHFRECLGLTLSSIGLGTYLGSEDDATDRGIQECAAIALSCAINVLDTAVNYRGQRSERAIGRAVATAVSGDPAARAGIFVSTKGGFIPHDSEDPRSPDDYAATEYLETGRVSQDEIAAGCHSLAPKFLERLIDQSRDNLGLRTIDLYYLHNPETQLKSVDRSELRRRLRDAAEALERACAEGRIAAWGAATWDGLRVPPSHPAHLSLAEIVAVAREVAGEGHHFAAVQAPLNLAMPQAAAYPSQLVGSRSLPLLDAARELGIAVFGSASLLQGRLVAAELPPEVETVLGAGGTARAPLQFVRSSPGLACALVGVSRPEHARETLSLSLVAPAPPDAIAGLLT